MDTEQQVAQHYDRADIEQAILTALTEAGKDIDHLTPADLAGVDEFHLGWRAQTIELAQHLKLATGTRVLDIGSGIGGPARYFGEAHHCRVIGLDLTPGFVAAAAALTRRCGLSDRVTFQQGSALALPFAPASFDVATLIHVGMNIADKVTLFTEARRVLRPGGKFCVYDVMRMTDAELPYPMPWAADPSTSFVEAPAVYKELLAAAGFVVETERNRRDFVLDLAAAMRAKVAESGPPILGLHVIMGPAAKGRLKNVMEALEQGMIAPTEIILRAV